MRVLPRFLYRAPLLPVGAPLQGPLAEEALAIGRVVPEARAAYARRAAFRATPHGLWAGVGVGTLGATSHATTGPMRAAVTVAYARLWEIARERLDPAVARLRVAPSLVRDETAALWIAFGEDDVLVAQRSAEVDELLAAVLHGAQAWIGWAALREAAGVDDDLLFQLVDDGLLVHDGAPPLVGPPPLEWMIARHGDPTLAGEEPKHAVLVHEGEVVLDRAAVERAAQLAPVLFRLQEALAPPVYEHATSGARASFEATEEIFGAGAYDLADLALGRFGTPLGATAPGARSSKPDSRVVRAIVDAIVGALAAGEREVEIDPERLTFDDLALPPTFELMLAPMRERPGAPPGDGWLLGLHAPAGASWGRFLHAVGAPLAEALRPLAELEGYVDVDFAPTPRLGDLCAHPPVHARAIALTSWTEGALPLQELAVALDSARGAPTLQADGETVVPSPKWRVRSTMIEHGAARFVAGLALVRQHTPWALHLGLLADLPHVPRLRIGGFVVAPASWRLPHPMPDREALRQWRTRFGVPDVVQAGQGDELKLVALDDEDALDQLHGEPRLVYEVWPPLDAGIDASGRRLEAVVAVIADDGPPPPPLEPVAPEPAAGWHTWKLFGAADRADRVLHGAVAPAIAAAQAAGEIDGWFFLRYIDGPGRRDHLRLRVRAESEAAFAARLDAALVPARAAGDVVVVERAEYHREVGRYGAAAIDAVERVFESDSGLVLALATDEAVAAETDAVELLVASYDALAAGAGLDPDARHALAARRRDAHGIGRDDELAAEYRARQKSLRALLHAPAAPFTAHSARVAAALAPLVPERRLALLPPLLHLAANRLLGAGGEREADAFYLWERARESLARHGVR